MTDPIAELIDAASETLHASMHIPAVPEYPSDLYRLRAERQLVPAEALRPQ